MSRLHTRSPQPSLDMERQSVGSSASVSASASHELDEDTRRPTLHVRIVRGGSSLARGRPITRDTIAVMHDDRTEEGEESGAAAGVEESRLPPTAAAAEGQAQSPTGGLVRAATILYFFVAFGLICEYIIVPCFLCLRQRLIGRRSRNAGWWGCADTLRGLQNPRCWIPFTQLGRLSLDSTPWSIKSSERTIRRYIRAFFFSFRSNHYYIIHSSIHPSIVSSSAFLTLSTVSLG